MNRLEYTVLYLQSIWPNTKIVLMALLPNMASIRWGALGGSVATVEAQHGSNLEAASQCAWAARPMFGTAAAQAQPPCDVPPPPTWFHLPASPAHVVPCLRAARERDGGQPRVQGNGSTARHQLPFMRPGVLICRPFWVLRLTLAQVVRSHCAACLRCRPWHHCNFETFASLPDVLLVAAGHQPLQHGGTVRWLAPQQGHHRQADEVHGTHHQAAGGQAVGSSLSIRQKSLPPSSKKWDICSSRLPSSSQPVLSCPLYTDRPQLQLNLDCGTALTFHSTH